MSFIDYYEVLQISPNAESETVHRVYRMLATRYHPDNPETGNYERFVALKNAYDVLKDAALRSAYDQHYSVQKQEPLPVFALRDFTEGMEGESNRRMGVLCLLYHKRRLNPEEPGLSLLHLENMMSFPREHLRFTLWFLQQKKYVCFNDNSEYQITGEGTEHVEANSPKQEFLKKLLEAPQNVAPEPQKVAAAASAGGIPPVPWNGHVEKLRSIPWPAPPPNPQQSVQWRASREFERRTT